ncbi:MAG: YlbF family regulator [Oscillospiraceae bacterium]|nr:YlbF family regulator [Oscillospiraceae bacterium]
MDIIKMSRELGKELQKDERYIAYIQAKEANDNDEKLQDMIHQFEMKRMEYSMESGKVEKDDSRIEAIDKELQSLYSEIMQNENMIKFSEKRDVMDNLINEITGIITLCANGEDPDTCEVHSGCSGDCCSCDGCH